MTLGKARDAYLATLKGSTLPKTYTIKKTAVESLVSFLGSKAKVHAITRSDLARWFQDMREKGASTPTLADRLCLTTVQARRTPTRYRSTRWP
ncbi:hypothetical protein NX09_15315, partial [Xanthomonas vasicola]